MIINIFPNKLIWPWQERKSLPTKFCLEMKGKTELTSMSMIPTTTMMYTRITHCLFSRRMLCLVLRLLFCSFIFCKATNLHKRAIMKFHQSKSLLNEIFDIFVMFIPLFRGILSVSRPGGITCGAIDEPSKSSKAIDERVIINFRDKNVVIARFATKML